MQWAVAQILGSNKFVSWGAVGRGSNLSPINSLQIWVPQIPLKQKIEKIEKILRQVCGWFLERRVNIFFGEDLWVKVSVIFE